MCREMREINDYILRLLTTFVCHNLFAWFSLPNLINHQSYGNLISQGWFSKLGSVVGTKICVVTDQCLEYKLKVLASYSELCRLIYFHECEEIRTDLSTFKTAYVRLG